jgi:hypothetical protein
LSFQSDRDFFAGSFCARSAFTVETFFVFVLVKTALDKADGAIRQNYETVFETNRKKADCDEKGLCILITAA